jgi:hypothetical protein
MASVESTPKYCLLCGKELPHGGFSASVFDVYLYPVCESCQDRCSRDPHGVVAEYPQLFEGTAPGTQLRPPVQGQRPTITAHLGPQQVIVTDIHMPFGSMVGFMVKWAIASIPAIIILFLLGFVFAGILTAMTGFGTELIGR